MGYHPEPAYDGPAVYQYGYAVADDYSGSNFAANENRDGYATNGEYRVNLPDVAPKLLPIPSTMLMVDMSLMSNTKVSLNTPNTNQPHTTQPKLPLIMLK